MIVGLVFLSIAVAAITGGLCVHLFGAMIGIAVAPFAASITVLGAALYAALRR